MSLSLDAWRDGIQRFPRVSGDEPHIDAGTRPDSQFSPRERG